MATFDSGPRFDPNPPRRGWFSRNALWFIPLLIFSVVASCGMCCGGVAWFVFSILKGSTPYVEALDRVQHDPRVIAKLGEPVEDAWLPSGNISIRNDSGQADFNFDIHGPRGTASVHTTATMQNGIWTTTELRVRFADGETLNLLEEDEGGD